jgi:multidrug efflux pump subunit AcrA (membrane-fusion protein)
MKSFFGKIWSWIKGIGRYARTHKIIATIVIVIVVGGGYWAYTTFAAGSAGTQYVLATVTKGPLQVTVTGSGQVNSEDTLNVTPQGSASGQITAIYVTPGQSVKAGQVIAQLDDTNAAQAVTSARQDLESAQISYQQTLDSSHTSLTNDQTSIGSELATTYTGLPSIMTGLDGILHNLSNVPYHTAQENVDAYESYIPTSQSQSYEAQVKQDYVTATQEYQTAQSQFAAAGSVNSLTNQQLEQLAQTTITTTKDIDVALTDTLTYYNYINSQTTASKITIPSDLASQISSLTSYQSSVSGYNSTLTSDLQTITSDSQTLGSSNGSTPLNVQSAQLSLAKAQEALTQAETTDADYTVVAPFDGTIATVPVNKYDQGSSGTTIATLITTEEYADLSLNESDVAKVVVGQPVTLTFDALPNVTIQGTVQQVNPVGTVTQGVVTYDVRISFNQANPSVKPGMSVSATIITASETSAIQVPSSAVKTSGGMSYVQVATLTNASSTLAAASGTTSATGARRIRTASSTSAYAGFGAGGVGSTTGSFGFGNSTTSSTTPRIGAAAFSRSLTVPASEVTIKMVPVTIGLTSDTESEILSGLQPGEYVVTATQSDATTKATATPTATSLLGGSTGARTGTFTGGGGGGFTRTTGATAGAARGG